VRLGLTWASVRDLLFQSAQQAVVSEPVCRALEALLHGQCCSSPLMLHRFCVSH
jgi:hypothetical protein